jgi:heme-degrading monooxygenase HmoA
MIVKWIVCTVKEEDRAAFAKAQAQWSALAEVDGFCGQAGGWNLCEPNQACIIGLWRDETAYQRFMVEVHDRIFQSSKQQATYSAISVSLFESVLEIPGREPDITRALANGAVLRVADCEVIPGQEQSFLTVQHEIWNPGMQETPGQLGGLLSHMPPTERSHRHLVCSFWTNAAAHDDYVAKRVARLRERAQIERDVAKVRSSLILIEPTWKVVPL